MNSEGHFKDEIVARLAAHGNVAQFVSFGSALDQRFARIQDFPPDHRFSSLEEAVAALLTASPDGTVNIRSFEPHNAKSREFVYGLGEAGEVVGRVRSLAAQGLTTIVNETVDIHDGGVSGVAFGEVLEFAPEDIPRCVEKPGTASLPRALGERVLRAVYGFSPELPGSASQRVEWSLHPLRRGYRHGHTILWEVEEAGTPPEETHVAWPHRFSRFLGDKAFGLLIADAVGLPVPRTLVVARKVAPFSFGRETGLEEVWIRTCPTEQVPGYFTTRRGWTDPFALMQREDPEGTAIASVLAQSSVEARYSGALVAQPEGEPLIEGVAGHGDLFMAGERSPDELPGPVVSDLLDLYEQAHRRLGPVRCEWVHDGRNAWIVQLHAGASATSGRVIFPGEASRFHPFPVEQGIEALRGLIASVRGTGEGIALVGRVGVTSHLGDVLRRAEIPSRLEDPPRSAAGAA
jgi:hypothetical protein